MQRLLPPLVLVLVFGVVAYRCAQSPSRYEARTRIAGHVQGRQLERAGEELAAYLERFQEEEDHWFASRTFFRMGKPVDAIDTVWKHPTLPEEKGTARRFAEEGLFALGWSDEKRNDPSLYEVRALTYLVEGEQTWAEERLRRHASELEVLDTTTYFFTAYRLASRRPLEILVDVFRKRGEKTFDVAAALATVRTESYAGRDADLNLLIEVVGSSDWRRRVPAVWSVACFVLGRSGDARALEALESTAALLEGSSSERAKADLLLVRTGLLAAGQWAADVSLSAHAFGSNPNPFHVLWHLEALIHRYRLGDMRSELGLRRMWEGPGLEVRQIRWRIARAFLLQETIPNQQAHDVWVPRMLRELQAPEAPLMSRSLAKAYLLRKGADGAREGVLDLMRRIGEAYSGADRTEIPDLVEAFLEALRALHLYG